MKKQNSKMINAKEYKLSTSIKFTIVAIVLIAVFCVALTPITLQNDTYYTIKIGEHIVNSGIDMKDPFSWHQDLSYTYPHWAYDVCTYFIYNAFGMTGIYITTCILTVILGISLYFVNTKLAKNKIISFIVTIGAMYFIRGYIAARAQLVTFILFVLTIFLIEKFLETKKKRYATGLIAIPIIIANFHVAVFPFYFILYLPYIAEYIIASFGETIIYRKTSIKQLKRKIKTLSKKQGNEEIINKLQQELTELEEKVDKIKIKRSKELQNPYKIRLNRNTNVRWLVLIMIVCMFAGLLTPLGDTPYTYLLKTMQGNTTQNINEHLPMNISNETEVMCVLIGFLAIMIFTKTKIRLCDLFMLGGLFYLMISSRRQVTMFMLICSIIFNKFIVELIQSYTKIKIENIEKKVVTIIGTLVLTILMLVWSYYLVKDKKDNKYIDESTYPVQACDYIIQNVDLGKSRFYNEYNYGSYMLYRGIPVFIDSRADLYVPEFSGKEEDIFMDFIDTSSIGKFYGDTFEKYGITHVITYKNSKMNMIITKTQSSKYEELYSDKYFVVYKIAQ